MKRKIGLVLILAIMLAGFILSNSFTRSENYSDEWWNSSWQYRIRFDMNTSGENRTDWPVEYDMNFTYLLENMSVSGIFDNLSLRLVEYNISSGSALHEMPVQFEQDSGYNASTSATGEIIFILNGTTWYNESVDRHFYLYFDITENGQKEERIWTFSEFGYNMSYSTSGDQFTINNTDYIYYFDTSMGENTSGLYRIYDIALEEEIFIYSTGVQRTREYLKFTNGSHNFTWDLNMSMNINAGDVRITVTQTGDEIYWNEPDNKTNETSIVKKYYFYPKTPWYRLEYNITNNATYSVNRSSEVGAPAFDANLAYDSTYKIIDQNKTDPGSWVRVSYSTGGHEIGIILENESASIPFVDNSTALGIAGVNVDTDINMTPNSSLWIKAVFVAGDTLLYPELVGNIKDNVVVNPVVLNTSLPEKWIVVSESQTNYTIYNRNETILLWINITIDGWNLTNHTNATFDMGTPSTADDITIVLYDDGDSGHGDQTSGDNVWSNLYVLPNDSIEGEWNYTARVYNKDGYKLNESYYPFNVTAQFYLNLTILNPSGLPDRKVNATFWAKNYRQDTNISNAEDVNCTFYHSDSPGDKTNVDNITDNGDGSYSINFTAPSGLGLYYLNCTAIKNGNNGTQYDNFAVESPTTNATVAPNPVSKVLTNVTWYDNESFILEVTMSNIGNGTAYDTNITMDVPQNFSSNETFYSCSNILIDLSCVRYFNITALASSTNETHTFNITTNWTNPDNSTDYNYTLFNVTITQNPVMVVDTNNLSVRVGAGFEKHAGTININSTGNYRIEDVNFTVSGFTGNFNFTFSPPGSISFINPANDQNVDVTVNVSVGQEPGIFNGTLNVSTSNDGFHIVNMTVIVSGTNVSMNVTPENYTTDIVNWYTNDTFNLSVNITNIGGVTAFDTEINLSMNLNYFNVSNGTSYDCGNVSVNASCNVTYNLTVMNGTPAGNYTINVTVSWEEIDIGVIYNWTIVNVSVTPNVTLEVDKTNITGSLEHGTSGSFGNITVLSTGNDIVYNVTLNLTGLESLSATLSSEGPHDLSTGQSQLIHLNATTPFAYTAGTYNGTLNITSNNAENYSLNVSIIVPVNGSWYINETLCEHSQTPDEGVACTVLVNNTGNAQLDFNITPAELNHTNVSVTNFTLNSGEEYELIFYYNVTGIAGQDSWVANYTINATNFYSDPNETNVTIYLNPYIKPLVDIEVIPSSAEQTDAVTIYSNVTIQSDRPIQTVDVTVTRPDGTNTTVSMTQLYWLGCTGSGPGSKSCWYANYPSTWGNTTYTGSYTVWVYAEDDLGENQTNSTGFYVYTKLDPIMFTLNDEYSNQGYQGTIYYRAKDSSGEQNIGNTTVDVIIENPDNQTIFNKSYLTESDGFIRNDYGGIYIDFPIYGYPAGNYTIFVNSTYWENQVSLSVTGNKTYNFTVVDHPPSYGIHADMRIYPLWYQNSIMKFVMWFTDSSGMLTDPDNISLYITDPADNPYFSTTMASMTMESTGVYTYNYAMPVNSAIGIYDVALNATIGGYYTVAYDYIRVSMGGPYDVILNLLEYEVDSGDFLDFELYTENMGDVDNEDVLIEYWVSGEGQTWDYQQFSANIRASENKTFTRNAFIFTSQPPGTYTLNAKVTYDTSNNLYAVANATFTVTGEAPPSSPPGGDEGGEPGPGPGAGGGQATLNITWYEKEVGVEAGVIRYLNIFVKNTGDASATGVHVTVRSTDDGWFVISSENVETLNAGEEAIFTLRILVPLETPSGQYEVMITASSNQSETSEIFTLFVFTSRKELIDFELIRLKAKLKQLKSNTVDIKAAGFDVSPVENLINDIEDKIDLAENYIEKEIYDAALEAVYDAWELIREAENLLDRITTGGVFPWWVILIAAFAAIIIVLGLFMRKTLKNLKILMKGRMSEARHVAGVVKTTSNVDALRTEKAKNQRMIGLLDGQYRSGIISKDAYESMKKRSEEKINDIEKKIRESLK